MAGQISLPFKFINGFVFTEKLGQGTFAVVYKAFKQSVNKREVVAIKCISKRKLNKISVERLLTEITLMKEELTHPHIVQMIDFMWDDHSVYIVMEYCSGGDLASLIQRYRMLDEDTAKRFLQQLASALKFLREKNVVHMDLKPQNILLSSESSNPCLKLADFGMAQHLDTEDHADSFRGSPLYMAPEIFLADHYDAKVDLWSVGVILFETLFGHAPYSSHTTSELIEKIRQDVPITIPQRPQVSQYCKDLLNGLLQRDPVKRISFNDFFGHPFIDLEHMASEENLSKAVSLVKSAIAKDSEGESAAAINLYCESLEYFIPIIKYEQNLQKKEELRRKVQQYITRAETLKNLLKQNKQRKPEKLLDEMGKGNEAIRVAMDLALQGSRLDAEQNFSNALKCYERSIEKLMPIVEGERDIIRKKALTAEVAQFLKRAEELKTIIRKLPEEKHSNSWCKQM